MNSYYAACDCGWTSKRKEYDFSASQEARKHTANAHRVPTMLNIVKHGAARRHGCR